MSRMLFCSNYIRCSDPAESCAISSMWRVAGCGDGCSRFADATVWPRLMGNCHTHRDTEETIVDAGFRVDGGRRELTLPPWVPLPVVDFTIGRAVKPRR